MVSESDFLFTAPKLCSIYSSVLAYAAFPLLDWSLLPRAFDKLGAPSSPARPVLTNHAFARWWDYCRPLRMAFLRCRLDSILSQEFWAQFFAWQTFDSVTDRCWRDSSLLWGCFRPTVLWTHYPGYPWVSTLRWVSTCVVSSQCRAQSEYVHTCPARKGTLEDHTKL